MNIFIFITCENTLIFNLQEYEIEGIEMQLHGKNVCSWCYGSSDQSFMVDPLSYFLFQPVFMTGVIEAVVCGIPSMEWWI